MSRLQITERLPTIRRSPAVFPFPAADNLLVVPFQNRSRSPCFAFDLERSVPRQASTPHIQLPSNSPTKIPEAPKKPTGACVTHIPGLDRPRACPCRCPCPCPYVTPTGYSASILLTGLIRVAPMHRGVSLRASSCIPAALYPPLGSSSNLGTRQLKASRSSPNAASNRPTDRPT